MTILSNNIKQQQQQSSAQQVTSATATTTTSNPVIIPTSIVVNSLDSSSSLVAQSSAETENKTEVKSLLPAENAINTSGVGQPETSGVDLIKISHKTSSGTDDAKTVNIQINDIQTVSLNFLFYFIFV